MFSKLKQSIFTNVAPNSKKLEPRLILMCLVAGSFLLIASGENLGFNLASLSYIKQNIVIPDSDKRILDYTNKVIYYKNKPTVLLPANDKEYELYPKNCVWFNRNVQKYKIKKKNSSWETVSTYNTNTYLATKFFYSDSVHLGNLFINSQNFKEFCKKGKDAFKLNDIVSNLDDWLNYLGKKFKYDISLNGDYLNFKGCSDLRVGFKILCIDPNQNVSTIGQLDKNKFLGKIIVNNKPTIMLISNGNYTAEELIRKHYSDTMSSTKLIGVLGLLINIMGFLGLNKELSQRLFLSTTPNKRKLGVIFNSLGLLYSLLNFKIGFSRGNSLDKKKEFIKKNPLVKDSK